MRFGVAIFLISTIPLTAVAHHSAAGRYDVDSSMEIRGEVVDVQWSNPHAYITVQVTDENGERVSWEVETGAPSVLRRAGMESDTVKEGDFIWVAGWPPVTEAREIFASNIRLPTGEELLVVGWASPIWTSQSRSDFSFWNLTEGDTSRPELGIFRVWSTTLAVPESMLPINRTEPGAYPLREVARAAVRTFDPTTDNPTNNCTPKGMPTIMDQPFPIEFFRDGNNIQLRIEEYDIVRTIHMDTEVAPSETQPAPLGYSVGEWEDSTLVVTTTHLNWPWFNQHGIPQSAQSILSERFRPMNDGSRLDYELTVTDPINFTEPVTLRKFWLYDRSAEILPFDCQVRG